MIKTKLSRRMFMRAAPLAPLATTAAVKQIAMEAATAVSGGGMMAPPMSGGVPFGGDAAYSAAHKGASGWVAKLISGGSRPEWRVASDRIWARRRALVLDSDIDAMRSVAPSFKRLRQAEREFDRILDEEAAQQASEKGWRGLLEKFGYRSEN